jgi:hypothetical protein
VHTLAHDGPGFRGLRQSGELSVQMRLHREPGPTSS